ncbi:MAG: hypothetical protein AAFX06_20460 [Planctomycetota bacterium]
MDFKRHTYPVLILLLLVASHPLSAQDSVEFDVPSIVPAIETASIDQAREVTVEIPLSSLVIDANQNGNPNALPPIDHLLVRCRFRQPLHIVDYEPRTELQSDYEGAVVFTNKRERTDSFGLGVNGQVQTIGGQIGRDDAVKQSNSTEYQKRAPQQAVVAAGTTDRGRGVYFKFRWTADQVLEGEKRFRFSVAVPESWRGGLIDVSVTANGLERPLFGAAKLKTIVQRDFVIAAHQQNDVEAASIAVRLARLDRRLAQYASGQRNQSHSVFTWWKRPDRSSEKASDHWYRAITRGHADPYLDQQIKKLPMAVRVAVLDYADTSRELKQLNQTKPQEAS